MSQQSAQNFPQKIAISLKSTGLSTWQRLRNKGPVIAVIVGVSLLMSFLIHQGFFKSFETPVLDAWRRLRPPLQAQHVRIVGISETDYKHLFHETSPLDPKTLQEIIHAIVLGKPRIIVVDLDTSAQKFKDLRPSPSWPPVIWARDAEPLPHRGDLFQPLDVLGGKEVPLWGIARVPQDPDSMIRHYQRVFKLQMDGSSTTVKSMPSLPWAIVKAFCSGIQREAGDCRNVVDREQEHGVWLLHLARASSTCKKRSELEQRPEAVQEGLPCIAASDVRDMAKGEGWQTKGPLKDKIVLLGGLYRAARDEYSTPLGPMYGVVLMAQAVESELQGRLIRHNEVLIIVLHILGGLGLAGLFSYFQDHLRRALLCSLLAIPILALLSSFLASRSLALWAYFVPVLIAVLFQELYEHAKESQKLALYGRLHGHKTAGHYEQPPIDTTRDKE